MCPACSHLQHLQHQGFLIFPHLPHGQVAGGHVSPQAQAPPKGAGVHLVETSRPASVKGTSRHGDQQQHGPDGDTGNARDPQARSQAGRDSLSTPRPFSSLADTPPPPAAVLGEYPYKPCGRQHPATRGSLPGSGAALGS